MDLFADYLGYRRGAPNNGHRISRSALQLHAMVTGVPYLRKASLATLPYWHAYINFDPLLDAYLKSPKAFRAPEAWPEGFGFPAHLTPSDFARDFTPKHRGKDAFKYGTRRYENWCFRTQGLHELMAYAISWPLTVHEIERARLASFELMRVPSVLAYALVDISNLPLRFGGAGYLQRVQRWHKATTDPLALGTGGMLAALPKWCATPEQMMDICPPRHKVLGSSSTSFLIEDP